MKEVLKEPMLALLLGGGAVYFLLLLVIPFLSSSVVPPKPTTSTMIADGCGAEDSRESTGRTALRRTAG